MASRDAVGNTGAALGRTVWRIVLPALLALGGFLGTHSFSAGAQPAAGQNIKATVVRLVDGDTMIVALANKRDRVRLIGIDTPESKDNDKAEREARRSARDVHTILALGQRSYQFIQSKLPPGTPITLEFDVAPRDKYGRLLAYVYLSDGTMLNQLLVREGYARLFTDDFNHRYRELFAKEYSAARKAKRGLWRDD